MQSFGIGFLAQPPRLVETNNSIVCNFRLATIETRMSGSEKIENTHFLDYELWDSAARYFHDNASVGDSIYVESIPRERRIPIGDKNFKSVTFRVTKFNIFKKQDKAIN